MQEWLLAALLHAWAVQLSPLANPSTTVLPQSFSHSMHKDAMSEHHNNEMGAVVMNNPHQPRPIHSNLTDGHGLLLNIPNLSLSGSSTSFNVTGRHHHQHQHMAHSTPVGVGAAINNSHGHIMTAGSLNNVGKPALNILSQASSVTQLNANNTIFDPTVVAVASSSSSGGGQQQANNNNSGMIPSFLIQPSSSTVSSASASHQHHHQLSTAPTHQHQHQIPIPLSLSSSSSSRPPSSLQHHKQQMMLPSSLANAVAQAQRQQQQQHAMPQFQRPHASSLAGSLAVSPPQTAMQHHQPQQLQQQPSTVPQIMLHQQQQQQQQLPPMPPGAGGMQTPMYAENQNKQYQQEQEFAEYTNDYDSYPDGNSKSTSPTMNGRVPATRKDGRKLFVGGLPNGVTDLSFLQYFQQYGEVIDSVVLLDRRTKRSRGFGFVTFADPNVSAALLTTIPGRTGMVNILGKNCELKASEPKSAEAAQYAHSTINLPPPQPYHSQPHNSQYNQHMNNMFQQQQPQQQQQQQWSAPNQMPQRMGFNATGASNNASGSLHNPLHVDQTMPIPPKFVGHKATGVPIYSHSTIVRTIAGPDGASHDGGAVANVYIQNNFYTLPPGLELAPTHALTAQPKPEVLQAQQVELMNSGIAGAMAGLGKTGTVMAAPQPATVIMAPQYTTPATGAYSSSPTSGAYSSSALQPSYPGPDATEEGQLQQQHQLHQQINTIGHTMPYTSGQC